MKRTIRISSAMLLGVALAFLCSSGANAQDETSQQVASRDNINVQAYSGSNLWSSLIAWLTHGTWSPSIQGSSFEDGWHPSGGDTGFTIRGLLDKETDLKYEGFQPPKVLESGIQNIYTGP